VANVARDRLSAARRRFNRAKFPAIAPAQLFLNEARQRQALPGIRDSLDVPGQ